MGEVLIAMLTVGLFLYVLLWWDDPAIRRLNGEDKPEAAPRTGERE